MPKEGLSRLSKKCHACPFVDKCDHKEMEALAYLLPAAKSSGIDNSLYLNLRTVIQDENINCYR